MSLVDFMLPAGTAAYGVAGCGPSTEFKLDVSQ